MSSRLAGKSAIVTGGAQGIGMAIVRRFLEEGAKVALIDQNRTAVERAQSILGPTAGLAAFVADVSDAKSVDVIFDPLVHAIGSRDFRWARGNE